jgi:transaldolase/glucose-6-phosphate isomerase
VSLNRQTYKLPGPLAGAVTACIEDWKKNNKVARLWQRDASLWTGADEGNWLGWLTIVDEQLAHLEVLKKIVADVKKARFKHA